MNKKPKCEYGRNCYRKNPEHLEKYDHFSYDKGQNTKKVEKKRSGTLFDFFETKQGKPNEPQEGNKSPKRKKVCPSSSTVESAEENDRKPRTQSEVEHLKKRIKELFLREMPQDFYDFYEFCVKQNKKSPKLAFQAFGLTLVGPFEVLTGDIADKVADNVAGDVAGDVTGNVAGDVKSDNEAGIENEKMLCHWRYFFDPPEFITVLSGPNGFHIGYWMDSPNESLTVVASNSGKDCIFHPEGDNLFCAVYHLLEKRKASNEAVETFAKEHSYSLSRDSKIVSQRKKKVVSKTFHNFGIVVPVDKETELGYRPLIETSECIKKTCKLIIGATSREERTRLMDKLQPLITAANIANDECDFGNSLELGIDLFCMGSVVFHDVVRHLLTTAYTLLNRPEYASIITAHLKNRKKLC